MALKPERVFILKEKIFDTDTHSICDLCTQLTLPVDITSEVCLCVWFTKFHARALVAREMLGLWEDVRL